MSRGVKNNQIVNSSYLLGSILQIFIPVTLEIATKKADRICENAILTSQFLVGIFNIWK